MNPQPIIIAGGGIGGLAAAVGLAQKGVPTVVLEKAPALGEIGAGIQLGPNAFHCFDYLGVGDAARAIAIYVDNLRLMDAMSGEEKPAATLSAPRPRRDCPQSSIIVVLGGSSSIIPCHYRAFCPTYVLRAGESVIFWVQVPFPGL